MGRASNFLILSTVLWASPQKAFLFHCYKNTSWEKEKVQVVIGSSQLGLNFQFVIRIANLYTMCTIQIPISTLKSRALLLLIMVCKDWLFTEWQGQTLFCIVIWCWTIIYGLMEIKISILALMLLNRFGQFTLDPQICYSL